MASYPGPRTPDGGNKEIRRENVGSQGKQKGNKGNKGGEGA